MKELTQELVKIREKIDAAFLEFEEKHTEQTERTDFLIPLILDEFQDVSGKNQEQKLLEQAGSCGFFRGISFPADYVVIITSLYDEGGENCTSQGHIHSVDIILRKYLRSVSFYSGGKVISLLAGTSHSFDKYLHIALEEVIQNVERILQKKCSIGVSRVTDRLSGLHEAYREATNAGSYFEKEVSGVHFLADEEPVQSVNVDHISSAVSEIKNLIRSGSKEQLKDCLMQLFNAVRQEKMPVATLNLVLLQLIADIGQSSPTIADSEKDPNVEKYMQLQQMFVFSGTLDEAENKFVALCLDVQETIVNQRRKSSTILCEKAVQMIESEYGNQEMSLNYVSGRINVSPNYLSAMLKKKKGKSFVDLLTAKRMNAAREMLLYSPLKIREISEKCGYNDQHYFSYCFKKYMGISPGAMRQQEQGAGSLTQ